MLQRVLLIRQPELCSELCDLLHAEGFACSALPATTTEYITPEKLEIATPWVAFTSANGVRGLFEALRITKQILPFDVMIAAVGESTANAVRVYFAQEPEVISSVGTGAHLAEELSRTLPLGTQLLYPCPDQHRSDFADICRSNGLLIHALPVYRTIAREPRELSRQLQSHLPVDAAVFFAPSAVHAFHRALPLPWPFAAIAIGPTTQRALSALGHSRISTATHPDALSITKAVRASLMQHEPDHV